MPQLSPARATALSALTLWDDGNTYAQDILADLMADAQLSQPDRALAKELFFGCIRQLGCLDRLIAELRSRGSLKRRARQILRIGLYQLFFTDIAEHAAVHETVSLAKKHERGLINAILRNAQRSRADLQAQIPTWPLADQLSHPGHLIRRWTEQHSETIAEQLCQWNNSPPPVFARICDEEAFHRAADDGLYPIEEKLYPIESAGSTDTIRRLEDFPEFIQLPSGPPPQDLIDRGIIYIQDPSTSIAPWLLAPMPGETILDACAAPGGKTAMLAAMCPTGVELHATDSSPHRIERMRENFARLHISEQIQIHEADWSQPVDLPDLPKFDAILLDVPCSNTGVMRRRVDVRWRLSKRDFTQLPQLQSQILEHAKAHLKPGGRIIYSTCSIDAEENRQVIEASGMTVTEIQESLPWRDRVDGAFAARMVLA